MDFLNGYMGFAHTGFPRASACFLGGYKVASVVIRNSMAFSLALLVTSGVIWVSSVVIWVSSVII
jgi:hypothetical protein